MEIRRNIMNIGSIDSFLGVRGNNTDTGRDVYFVRSLGETADMGRKIQNLDARMQQNSKDLAYLRMGKLPPLQKPEDLEYYSQNYINIQNNQVLSFKNLPEEGSFRDAVKEGLRQTCAVFQQVHGHPSETMVKNLTVKLLFWLDCTMGPVFQPFNEKKYRKILASQVDKTHEYLFFLLLTFLGCDVLILANQQDIPIEQQLLAYSQAFSLGPFGKTVLPEFRPLQEEPKPCGVREMPRAVIPPRPDRKHGRAGTVPSQVQTAPESREKTFEELAQLASSIVMIAIHDREGEVVGTGSGIMIGEDGFILTNHHVASGGVCYSVRIEDDEQVYVTREIIKYNSETDLAILRINRKLKPLKIYRGEKKLVRGQKVVAIGSPLGMFNSVSDGIISGFRTIQNVDMIQFTAPISHGSSGGAVLNMRGEVIGISTGGLDNGQNINLAVGYENIRAFALGIIK